MITFTRSTYIAALFLLVISSPAMANKEKNSTKQVDRPSLHATEVKKFRATVSDINYEYMRVTLTDDEGKSMTLTIDPRAKNFAQVQKGDKVFIETVDAFAIHVTPRGEKPVNDSITYVHVAKPGEKPHGVAVQTRQINATVETIDYETRVVSLKGPDGNIRILRVDPVVKRFKEIQKGDLIRVKITEAIALSVTGADLK